MRLGLKSTIRARFYILNSYGFSNVLLNSICVLVSRWFDKLQPPMMSQRERWLQNDENRWRTRCHLWLRRAKLIIIKIKQVHGVIVLQRKTKVDVTLLLSDVWTARANNKMYQYFIQQYRMYFVRRIKFMMNVLHRIYIYISNILYLKPYLTLNIATNWFPIHSAVTFISPWLIVRFGRKQ